MRHDSAHRLDVLSLGAREELFRMLSSAPETRAAAIRELHQRATTRELADVLIDLEAEPVVRLEVLRLLRDSLREL
jgi:hypothetical protein